MSWDFFISHAHEDKDLIARPLAHALTQCGFNVWFDESTLKVGDSLLQSINRGLAESQFGILTPHWHTHLGADGRQAPPRRQSLREQPECARQKLVSQLPADLEGGCAAGDRSAGLGVAARRNTLMQQAGLLGEICSYDRLGDEHY